MADIAIQGTAGATRTRRREARPAPAPSLRDLAVQAFYTRRLILGCLAAGVLAGAVAALLSRPTYTAESLLLVRTDAAETVRDEVAGLPAQVSGEAAQRLMQSDIQILKSDPVVRTAAEAVLGPKAARRGAAAFTRRIKVEALPNSNVIRLTVQSPDRILSLRAAGALIEAYRLRRQTLYRSDDQDLQSGEIGHARQQITDLDQQVQAIRGRYGVLDIAQDVNLASARLDALRQRAAQVRERSAAVGGELAASNAGLASTPARVLDTQDSANASPNDDARNTLLRLRQEREHMAAQYAADYPGLQEIDRKIAAAAAQVAANGRERYASERTVRNPVRDQLEAKRAGLMVESQSLARDGGELSREIGQAQARVDALREADAKLRDLARAREVAEGLFRQLSLAHAGSKLAAEAVDSRDGTLRVVQPPTAPLKARDLTSGFLLGGLMAGLGAAIALSSLAAALRQVFLTPNEVRRALWLEPLGEFAPFGAGAASDAARLAARLRDTRVEGAPARVAQIAGLEREAKSAVALALCRALASKGASAQGRPVRVLLADPDTEDRIRRRKRPTEDRRLTLSNGALTVAEGGVRGLWVALDFADSPLGDPGAEAADAKAFLDQLRSGFDWVVIAAETNFTAYEVSRRFALVDVNLVSIEAEATRAAAARALVEALLTSGGRIAGFVFCHRRLHIPKVLMRWL